MDYEAIMVKARKTNVKRDVIERKSGFVPESECHPFTQIRTAMLAIECGIKTDDWNAVAEAQAVLENVVRILREATGEKW